MVTTQFANKVSLGELAYKMIHRIVALPTENLKTNTFRAII